MAEYYSSEGASAANGDIADYSGNYFSYTVDGEFDAYYITRYADAIAQASASLTGNTIWVNGSLGGDQVFINAQANATENATATSYGNFWFLDLGEGDDASGIYTGAAGVSAGTVVTVSYDSATLLGGAGADILQATQYLGSLDHAYVSIDHTSRHIDGGDGFDSISAWLNIDCGFTNFAGGTANYSDNNLYVDAGADGANIFATTLITALWGGAVDFTGNSSTLLGGGGTSFINANVNINAGSVDAGDGAANYWSNSLYLQAGAQGGDLYAQNSISVYQGGYASFAGNVCTLVGGDGADMLGTGVGVTSGSSQFGVEGGYGAGLNNTFTADGGGGDDRVAFFLYGLAELGGIASLSGNSFYGTGGDGNDTLEVNWWNSLSDGVVEISSNFANLDGGSGSDTFNTYMGEWVSHSSINIFGGDGDDYIFSSDLGQYNERLISGGSGNDTIIDDVGFSTVVFEGVQADYSFTNLGGGWISVSDNRDGSPDGADQLYQVDQLRFSDGDVLVADLSLPIEGTEGDDTLLGSDDDDIIYGYGGNDNLRGFAGNDLLDGGSGNDVLTGLDGDDTLLGGDGNDQLIGNRGADQLTGGAGADRFIFGALFQSTVDAPDLITDYSGAVVLTTNSQGRVIRAPGEGDKIDLSFLDANANVTGDQAFTLVQHGFSGSAGQVYSSFDAGTGITSLFLDVDGDAMADMTIQLLGQANLTGADFIL